MDRDFVYKERKMLLTG